MSRCFPFPPPGYERKARTDDVGVLKKEKQREKKHKKDKKDKDKREKEKSEKDRSDGKHREKKDKKEKNRNKKKDKEKDTDKVKDKLGTSDGTTIPWEAENHVPEKLFHKDDRDKRNASQVGGYPPEKLGQNSHLPAENRNSVSVEVARKTKDDARGIGNQLVEKIIGSDCKTDEGTVRLVDKGTGILAEAKGTSKDKRAEIRKPDVQEVRVATWVSEGAMVQNSGGMVQPKVPGLPKPLENNVQRKTDAKEKTKEKEGDDKRGEKRKDKDREKKSHGIDKDRDKEKKKEEKAKKKNASKTAEPDKEKKKEDKANEKNKTAEPEKEKKKEDKANEKNKTAEPEKEKKKEDKANEKTKTLEPDKEKKENKANEKNGSKHAEPYKSKDTNNEVHIDSLYSKPSHLLKDSNKTADAEGNHKKRKDLKTNGVLHANEIRPNKLLRPSSSSHLLTENGRTPEPCQTSIPCVSDKHRGANSVKVDGKDNKKNGIIEARPSSVSPAKPASTIAKADPFAEASMRPPHPDSRYLNEVYMVPKMEELPDDDQDWLFGCSDTKNSKKPKVETPLGEETAQVWSEALQIESADVCALPYVIPY